MRKPLVALLLLLSFAHLADAQTRNAREKAGLRGAVKSVRLESSEIHEQEGKQVESRRALVSVTRYDETGNEMEESIYANGVLQGKIISGYVAQGDFTRTHYNPRGAITARSIAKYDGSGKITELAAYDANGTLTRKVIYAHSDLGNLTEQIDVHYNRPALSSRTVYFYDETGNPTLSRVYDADGVLKYENSHTSAGVNVVQHKKDGSTTLEEAKLADISFEYDSQGNWTKRSHRRRINESGQTREVVEVTYRKITYH